MTRLAASLVVLLLLTSWSLAPSPYLAAAPTSPTAPTPLFFVENVGQWAEPARFQLADASSTFWLMDGGIRVVLPSGKGDASSKSVSFDLRFEGANPAARLEPVDRLPATFSFYEGQNPARWQPRVPVWAAVRYVNLYPGLDLELRGEGGRLVLRWVGSSAGVGTSLSMHVVGAELEARGEQQPRVRVGDASYPFPLPAGELRYDIQGQDSRGQPVELALAADDAQNVGIKGEAGIELEYATYYGSIGSDEAADIATGGGRFLYLSGFTYASEFPRAPGVRVEHVVDAFLGRLDMSGAGEHWVTVLRGAGTGDLEEFATSLALDGEGGAVFAGHTNSADFPITPNAYDTTFNGVVDAFIAGVNPDGTLAFSTYFGGDQDDGALALAIDDLGIYAAGRTWSADLPTTPDAYQTTNNGLRDVFLARFSRDGSALGYSSFLGGTSQEQAEAMVVREEAVYLAGWTRSDDFPTTPNAFQPGLGGGGSQFDAFVVKFAPGLDTMDYSTYLGATGEDRAYGLEVDGEGRAVVVGRTSSEAFPATAGAFDTSYGGGTCSFAPCPDAYVARLSLDGDALEYASFLGGSGSDEGRAVALDAAGRVHVTGVTQSSDFPTTAGAFDIVLGGISDAFHAEVSQEGDVLIAATFLGGDLEDEGSDIALDGAGGAYLTGKTRSTDFPTAGAAWSTDSRGDYDAFAAVFRSASTATPTATPTQTLPSLTPSTTATRTITPSATPTRTVTRSATVTRPVASLTPTMTPTQRPPALYLPLVQMP